MSQNSWSVVYERAIREDGSLYFPQRLTKSFLDDQLKSQGSFIFANQYQNEIVPDGESPFKKEWIKYYDVLPEQKHTFAFVDPAISEKDTSDFTAVVVVDVDVNGTWYLKAANRYKINPTKLVDLIFAVNQVYKCQCIGIEEVAYQKALLYMVAEEMTKRQLVLPIKGIHPGTTNTKQMRIMGLVPRFEWNKIYLAKGLSDFEMEFAQFPRGKHDDLLDALASLEQIVFYPTVKQEDPNERPDPNDPRYERWYIKQLQKRASSSGGSEEDYY